MFFFFFFFFCIPYDSGMFAMAERGRGLGFPEFSGILNFFLPSFFSSLAVIVTGMFLD